MPLVPESDPKKVALSLQNPAITRLGGFRSLPKRVSQWLRGGPFGYENYNGVKSANALPRCGRGARSKEGPVRAGRGFRAFNALNPRRSTRLRQGYGAAGALTIQRFNPATALPGFCVLRSASMKMNWSGGAAQSNCVP